MHLGIFTQKVTWRSIAISLLALGTWSGCQHAPVDRSSIIWTAPAGFTNQVGVIRSVRGEAWVISSDNQRTAATVSQKVIVGDTVETGQNAGIDLFLGDNGPVIRITEASSVQVEELSKRLEGESKLIRTRLLLKKGRMLGHVKKLEAQCYYEIRSDRVKLTTHGCQFDISSSGSVSIVSGKALVRHKTSSTWAFEGQTVSPPLNRR